VCISSINKIELGFACNSFNKLLKRFSKSPRYLVPASNANLRTERDALLVSSDWTQGADSPLTDEVQAEWLTYREELRDLPESVDPADPTWPTPPE